MRTGEAVNGPEKRKLGQGRNYGTPHENRGSGEWTGKAEIRTRTKLWH